MNFEFKLVHGENPGGGRAFQAGTWRARQGVKRQYNEGFGSLGCWSSSLTPRRGGRCLRAAGLGPGPAAIVRRSAFATTMMEDSDIATAAMRG